MPGILPRGLATGQRQAEPARKHHPSRYQKPIFTLRAYLDFSKESRGDALKTTEYIIKEERAIDAIERQIAFTKEYEDLGVKAPVWQSIESCIKDATAALPMRDITIDNGVSDLEVYADPLFPKVFYNLIDNALRYGGASMTHIGE